ncbi:MAG: PCYCGC motif-containing (lipo)protein [Chloroflexota bacterium]
MTLPIALRHHAAALGLVAALVIAPAATSCGQSASLVSTGNDKPAANASTALPAFLDDAPTTVREAYEYARANPTTLSQVPCFCGCEAAGHRNVLDCFVKELRADGTVVWDKMAYG